MNDTIKKIVLGSSYSLLALLTVKCIEVVISIIVARLLGPEKLGMFAIIRYFLDLLCIFTVIGIPTAMIKFIAELPNKSSTQSSIFTSFVVMLIPTIFICITVNLLSSFIAQNIYHEPLLEDLIRISTFTLFAMSLLMFGESILQGFQEIKKLATLRILYSVLAIPITVILVYYGNLKGAIISKVIIAYLSIILSCFTIYRIYIIDIKQKQLIPTKNHFLIDYTFTKKLFNLALPIFLSGLVMVPALWIVTTRLSLTNGFAQVGLFNVSYALMQVISFIPIAVGIPLLPQISQVNSQDPKTLSSIIENMLYIVGFITLFTSIIFALFSYKILLFLYGDKYLGAWQILIFLSTSAFLASLGYVVGYYLLGVSKMWISMGFNLLWFITLIGFSIPFVKLYGLKGLGFSYILSYAILTIGMLIYVKKTLLINLTHITLLLLSGLVFLGASYQIISHCHGKVFVLGSILLLFLFIITEYFLCPIKQLLFVSIKNILSSTQNLLRPVSRNS